MKTPRQHLPIFRRAVCIVTVVAVSSIPVLASEADVDSHSLDESVAIELNLSRSESAERAVYDVTVDIPGRKMPIDGRLILNAGQTEAKLALKVQEHEVQHESSLTLEGEPPSPVIGLFRVSPVDFTFIRTDGSEESIYEVDFGTATNGEFTAAKTLCFPAGTLENTLSVTPNFSRLDTARVRLTRRGQESDSISVPFSLKRSFLADLENDFYICFLKKIPFGTRDVPIVSPDGTETIVEETVYKSRGLYIANGLQVTIIVALCAVLLGAILGFLIGIIRSTHDRTGSMCLLNAVAKLYITIIRGTPMTVQLLIAYFIIFAPINNKVLVAVLAFGFNSGAYVAEIIRAGIMSIDFGQMEAARALGLSYGQGMRRIVLPQAIRNVLPALGNEFIVLLKDTSIASFIGLNDLARGGSIIRSQTYQAYMPFFAVAIIYLVLVILFSKLLTRLEHHLQKSNTH